MNTKNSYLKYAAIALVVVVLITAALVFIDIWESRQGKFSGIGTEDGIIRHNGKEYVLNKNIETFLVLGLDKYEDADSAESHDSGVQTDFLMLFIFDNETKQCTTLHINRDTMTQVYKLDILGSVVLETYTKQIALAYNYANAENNKIRCRNTKDSVEYLLNGIKVDHYLSLTMDAIAVSCDFVDGVEITVLDDFTGIDDTLVKGEKVVLNGETALKYVRTRYGLEDSTNIARMKRQQQYMQAFYDKISSRLGSDDEFLVKLVDAIDEYVVYDSSDQKMIKFIEKCGDYEFLGTKELEGESRAGEEFVEFYPDEDSKLDLIIDLFYVSKDKLK